jgi:hypothetical protein
VIDHRERVGSRDASVPVHIGGKGIIVKTQAAVTCQQLPLFKLLCSQNPASVLTSRLVGAALAHFMSLTIQSSIDRISLRYFRQLTCPTPTRSLALWQPIQSQPSYATSFARFDDSLSAKWRQDRKNRNSLTVQNQSDDSPNRYIPMSQQGLVR